MKAVIIGSYGHYEYALDGKMPVCFSAVAAGDTGEPLSDLTEKLRALGHCPKIYEDPAKMLDEEKPDVVIINSRMDKNAYYSSEALRRGMNVFCEKPVATELCGLDALENVYREAKAKNPSLVFAGMFGITSSPCFEAARRAVSDGKIGNVRLALAQKSYKLGRREDFYSSRKQLGGMIPWVSIHGIDWLVSICGLRFEEVFAAHSRVGNGGLGELEATALCQYVCSGGAAASVCADYLRPTAADTHGDDRLRIVGTKGIIEVSGGKCNLLDGDGGHILAPTAPEYGLFDSFLLEAEGKGKCISSAENAFYVTRAALLSRRSADEHISIKF